MQSNEYFDTILYNDYGRGICHQCGNHQSHQLRWCNICGSEFCHHHHTLIEAMRIAKNAVFDGGKHGLNKRPAYIAAIYKRQIVSAGFLVKDFEQYAESLLSDRVNSNIGLD